MTDYSGTGNRDTAAFVLRVIGWTLVFAGVLAGVVFYLFTLNPLSVANGVVGAVVGAILIVVTRVLRDR